MNKELKASEVMFAIAQARLSLQIGKMTKEKQLKLAGVLWAEEHIQSLIKSKQS